ncbi:ZCHC3 protein, partial [Chionis minor]|nr:ZCHC3 protein [Chionis minor]
LIAAALKETKGQRESRTSKTGNKTMGPCYQCGEAGHLRRNCQKAVWCHKCNMDSHATMACKKSGNFKK